MKKTKQRPAPLPGPRQAMREKPMVATVYFLLRFSVILVMVAQFFNKNFENVFLCVLTLICCPPCWSAPCASSCRTP